MGTIAEDGTLSGTWENNSQSGDWKSTYGNATRELCEYDYFVKIVTPPDESLSDGTTWYTEDGGEEIGPVIWGGFAIVQEVENDSCGDSQGLLYKSPVSPGLGYYTP